MARHALGRHHRASLVGLALAGVIVAGTPLRAEPRGSASETARLERELRELRSQLSDVQRAEQEHFEAVRRLLQKDGGAPPPDTRKDVAASAPESSEPTTTAAPVAPPPAPLVLTTVTGQVTSKIPLHDVYVYLEGFRSNAGRKATLEIVQTHKSFEPAFTVALAGTRATFPNRDTFFHNVFSPTPVPFDLGTYRADETSPSVPLNTPGVVDVFCNIHAQMHAQILVVPNRVFTRVADDGSFRLDKVPAGRRKLVAWGPGMRATRIEVNVPAVGMSVKLDLDVESPVRHKNKFGLPYGAYKE
ncbi:MAG TPA: hypothetical protein VGP07_00135 [Polyangia bacterium]